MSDLNQSNYACFLNGSLNLRLFVVIKAFKDLTLCKTREALLRYFSKQSRSCRVVECGSVDIFHRYLYSRKGDTFEQEKRSGNFEPRKTNKTRVWGKTTQKLKGKMFEKETREKALLKICDSDEKYYSFSGNG